MTTEAFTPPSPITIATAGPHAIPFPYETGAVRAAVEDLLTGQVTDLIFGTDFTVVPAKDEASGNLTLSGPALTAHTGKKLHITRESTEQQGWVGTQGQREKGLESQLDRLARRLQEVSRLARAAVRIAAPTLKPFVPQAGRAIIFNAQGQPMNGPDAIDIAQAQPNAAAAAASASAAAGSVAAAAAQVALAQTAEANAQAWAGTVNSTFLQTSSLRCALGGTANALTLTTGGSVVSVSGGQKFRAIMSFDCAGHTTLAVDGLAPVAIKTPLGSPVVAGYWKAGEEVEFSYDGIGWRVLQIPANSDLHIPPTNPGGDFWRSNVSYGAYLQPNPPNGYIFPSIDLSNGGAPETATVYLCPFTARNFDILVNKWAYIGQGLPDTKFVVYKSGNDGWPSGLIFEGSSVVSVDGRREVDDGATVLKNGRTYWVGFLVKNGTSISPIKVWPDGCGEIIDVSFSPGIYTQIKRMIWAYQYPPTAPTSWPGDANPTHQLQLSEFAGQSMGHTFAIWYKGAVV